MRIALITSLMFALAACTPKAAAPPAETAPAAEPETSAPAAEGLLDGWTNVSDATSATLSSQDSSDTEPFKLVCSAADKTLTASAGVEEVGFSNMAYPYELIFAGAPFAAELVPGADDSPVFEVKALVTPDMLAALSGATTARISVNDGYAFAESGVDAGDTFERFAARCAELTGVTPAPQP